MDRACSPLFADDSIAVSVKTSQEISGTQWDKVPTERGEDEIVLNRTEGIF